MKRDKLKDYFSLIRSKGVVTVRHSEGHSFRTMLQAHGVEFKESEVPNGYIKFRKEPSQ